MKRTNKNLKTDPKFRRAFEREVLRGAFVSLFWAIIQERKRTGAFTLKALAKSLGTNKAEVSRWFKGDPNWTVNTIAAIADALSVDIRVEAIDRTTKTVFTPAGVQTSVANVTLRAPTSTRMAPKVLPITHKRIDGTEVTALAEAA
jgi:transcriptional regulator with XRE-family HTH domain